MLLLYEHHAPNMTPAKKTTLKSLLSHTQSVTTSICPVSFRSQSLHTRGKLHCIVHRMEKKKKIISCQKRPVTHLYSFGIKKRHWKSRPTSHMLLLSSRLQDFWLSVKTRQKPKCWAWKTRNNRVLESLRHWRWTRIRTSKIEVELLETGTNQESKNKRRWRTTTKKNQSLLNSDKPNVEKLATGTNQESDP